MVGLCGPTVSVHVCFLWVTGRNGSGQNGMDKMVYGQNVIEQSGIWTKWYRQNGADKMSLNKAVWTKWYRQNGADKMVAFEFDARKKKRKKRLVMIIIVTRRRKGGGRRRRGKGGGGRRRR